MNKQIRYFYSLISILCCMIGLLFVTSCHSDDTPADSGSIRLVFRIYMPTTTTPSRAAEDSDEGEEWESAINPSKLHVILYSPGGKNIGALENVALVRTSDPNVYDVTGSMLLSKLLLDDGIFNGQIMVYANMDGVNDAADFDEKQVNLLTFSRNAGAHYIPMWGVKRLNVSLQAGSQSDIGTINLLRAEAKIKVELRQDMTEYFELTQVQLTQANASGYSLPRYENLKDLQDVQLLEHHAFTHFLGSEPKLKNINMVNQAIYVPEYENQDAAQATSIQLSLVDKRDGKTTDYTLPFVEYDANGAPTNTPVDIVRNHYYHFILYKGDDGMVSVQLRVRKWYYVQHDNILM